MELFTVNETAKMLRVSPITIRRYIASGALVAERVGRSIRIRREAIEDFIEPVVPSEPCKDSELPTALEALGMSVGIGQSKEPTHIAENKDEYLADAITASWDVRAATDDGLGRPTSPDDPLWNIIGIGESEEPDDVARNKHKYLADAIMADMN